MKKLVKGYNILQKSGLHDYLMEYFSVNDNHAEFVAKAEDFTETLKLQFEDVEEIKKLDDNTIETKIGTSYGNIVYIISGKLTVTKI